MPKKPPQNKPPPRRRSATSSGIATKPTSISELVHRSRVLGNLAKAREPALVWREWLQAQLGEELGAHLVDVALRDGELLVYADSAGWSHRLRYALAALQAQIAARESPARRVTLRLRPAGRV